MSIYTDTIQQMYVAYFNRPADVSGLANWEAYANGKTLAAVKTAISAEFAKSAEYTIVFQGLTTSQIVTKVYQNLLGRDPDAPGLTTWINHLADGSSTVSSLVTDIIRDAGAGDVDTLANKLSAAKSFTAALDTVAEINAYSGAAANLIAATWLGTVGQTAASLTTATAALTTTVANVVTGTTSAAGAAFTLTTGVDSITGDSGNNTISTSNGRTDGVATAASSFSAADSINGGTGTDTLALTFEGDFAANTDITLPAATITDVEVITVRNLMTVDGTGDTLTFDAANATGETVVASDRSTAAVAFTNVASGTTARIIGNGSATGNLGVTYAAATTAVALDVTGGTSTSTFTNSTVTTATTASITSSGTTANSLGAIDFGSATLLETVTIAAAARFLTTDLGNATNDFAANATVTVTGAAANGSASASSSGAAAVTLGTLDSNIKTLNASGLSAGGVSATLSATTQIVTGGTGNDTITTGVNAHTGSVDAGAGTADKLVLADTTHISDTTEGAIYKNFEVLQVADAVSIDMDLVTGSTIGAVVLADAGGTTIATDLSATQAANVTIAALNAAATLGIKNATTVGTQDTLTITVSDGDTTSSEAITTAGDLTIAGVETISITATDDLTLATMANMSGITSLTVTGAGDVSVTTLAHAVTANMSVNFSGLTADAIFNAAGATGNAIAYTGGAKVDTVSVGVVGGYVVSTGAGADSITLIDKTSGTSGDQITAGAGADTITFAAEEGQTAMDSATLIFAAGDSVSNSAGVTDVTNADSITAIAWDDGGTATAGQKFTLDTEVSATAVAAASTTAVVFGTTTVTNAFDFYVKYTAASADVYVYQDTDGDKILEAGEFMVKLVGDAAFVANNANDFSISSGNLVFTSNDAA